MLQHPLISDKNKFVRYNDVLIDVIFERHMYKLQLKRNEQSDLCSVQAAYY